MTGCPPVEIYAAMGALSKGSVAQGDVHTEPQRGNGRGAGMATMLRSATSTSRQYSTLQLRMVARLWSVPSSPSSTARPMWSTSSLLRR